VSLLPLCFAVAAAVLALGWRRDPTGPAVAAVTGSLAATAAYRLWGLFPLASWSIAEVGILAVLAGLVVRRSPVRRAVVVTGLLAVAAGATVLRSDVAFGPVELVGGVVLWGLPCAVAAVATGYPRYQRAVRARAVDDAQRAQRLDLAGDLHDFVAHDVSEMIAQAQAAALVTSEDTQAGQALRRIETAGLSAMAAMDRMVHMLRADPAPGLDDLPALTERFAASSGTRVSLAVPAGVPRELGSTIYRVVVEALTNVRRHAPAATRVAVTVTAEPDTVRVSVVDDGGGETAPARRGGTGLAGLAERVAALAGTMDAGPHDDGWRVAAVLPVRT
jgi:signal transduction histidine kinase